MAGPSPGEERPVPVRTWSWWREDPGPGGGRTLVVVRGGGGMPVGVVYRVRVFGAGTVPGYTRTPPAGPASARVPARTRVSGGNLLTRLERLTIER